MHGLALFAWFFIQTIAGPVGSPQLRIDAPPELAALRTRLTSLDPQRFRDIAQLVGITDAGPAIRVVLAPEASDFARGIAPWISGFAAGQSDLVVLFPARSPAYPHAALDDVLRHEVAHVLIHRAAGGQPVPRWFNEGLAMAAEHDRRFQDQTQLLYQLVVGTPPGLGELDGLFMSGQSDQTRAYAIAGALVHDLLQRHGVAACGEILKRMSRGASFEAAFADVVRMTPGEAGVDFYRRQRVWSAWAPLLTSSPTLWMGVTLLAILAIYRRWRRNRAIEKQWAAEEDGEIGKETPE